MHFHVTESKIGDVPHDLGGDHVLPYPTRRPTFDTTAGAVDAVMAAAFEYWGTPAEIHVEVSLAVELSMSKQSSRDGAVASWSVSEDEGALWALHACECADGTLAQLFAGRG